MFSWIGKKKINQNRTLTDKGAGACIPLSEKSRDEEECFAEEAAEMREKWAAEEEVVWSAHHAAMQPDLAKLAKAKRLVAESGVGDAACDILRIIWHWPSWSKLDNWTAPLAIENLNGANTAAKPDAVRGGKWLAWRWAGSNFRLELEVSANHTGGDSELGDLRLYVNEVDVLHLDVSQELGDNCESWSVFGVSGFRAGRWMTELNEIAGHLRIADSNWSRAQDREFYSKQAENIEL